MMTLTLEPMIGSSIPENIVYATRIAKLLDVWVRFDFNGHILDVNKYGDVCHLNLEGKFGEYSTGKQSKEIRENIAKAREKYETKGSS